MNEVFVLCVSGLVLVTDAVTAMGLPPGRHTLGQQQIDIQGLHAYVAGLHQMNPNVSISVKRFIVCISFGHCRLTVKMYLLFNGCSVHQFFEINSIQQVKAFQTEKFVKNSL